MKSISCVSYLSADLSKVASNNLSLVVPEILVRFPGENDVILFKLNIQFDTYTSVNARD